MIFSSVMGLLLGIFLTFISFLCLFGFSPDLAQMISPMVFAVLKDVGGPVAAGFGGAIAGAFCSYVFQQRNEKVKEDKSDISAMHKTFVRLSVQLNDFFSAKELNIYPHLTSRFRFIDIPKIPTSPSIIDQVDPRIIDIAVSLKNGEAIEVIYLAEARYKACFETFNRRNSQMDEFRAALKSAGLEHGGIEEIYQAVGQGQLIELHIMTEQMIEILDGAIRTLSEAMELTADMMDKKFKGAGGARLKVDLKEEHQHLTKAVLPYFNVDTLKAYLEKF
ncbi:hypothetical protein HXW90_08760 [Pseudomonas sp. Y39-6]|uniref:hypothetical protein n=1 Tax=Pseudomonas sp. Y39-6 TaxID=2749807 RepID=UPI00190FBFFB|nr:hypothetical protein [Pseudomonas sp. Y39-6]QPO19625.1 hypothetical protein HXW90_08760 [Pseudomonas sp. Y39-6]URS62747.1 hypothetical protein JN756_08765 [Pseudomonas sp. Y39-6]